MVSLSKQRAVFMLVTIILVRVVLNFTATELKNDNIRPVTPEKVDQSLRNSILLTKRFKTLSESPGKPVLQFPEYTDEVELFETNISVTPRLLTTFESFKSGCDFYPGRMRVKLRSQRHEGSRLTVLTACTKSSNRAYDQELRALSLQNKLDYCALHDYHFVDASESPQYIDTPFLQWQKPSLMRQLLHTSDWIVWIDCDALFINFTVPLYQFVDDKYDVIISKDWNGINSGVYFVRSSNFTEQLLDTQVCVKPLVDKTPWPYWAEQQALKEILVGNLTHHMKVVPQSWINSYTSKPKSTWRPGEFVGHNVDCPRPGCFSGLKQLARTVRDYWKSTTKKTLEAEHKFHISLLNIIAIIVSPAP